MLALGVVVTLPVVGCGSGTAGSGGTPQLRAEIAPLDVVDCDAYASWADSQEGFDRGELQAAYADPDGDGTACEWYFGSQVFAEAATAGAQEVCRRLFFPMRPMELEGRRGRLVPLAACEDLTDAVPAGEWWGQGSEGDATAAATRDGEAAGRAFVCDGLLRGENVLRGPHGQGRITRDQCVAGLRGTLPRGQVRSDRQAGS